MPEGSASESVIVPGPPADTFEAFVARLPEALRATARQWPPGTGVWLPSGVREWVIGYVGNGADGGALWLTPIRPTAETRPAAMQAARRFDPRAWTAEVVVPVAMGRCEAIGCTNAVATRVPVVTVPARGDKGDPAPIRIAFPMFACEPDADRWTVQGWCPPDTRYAIDAMLIRAYRAPRAWGRATLAALPLDTVEWRIQGGRRALRVRGDRSAFGVPDDVFDEGRGPRPTGPA